MFIVNNFVKNTFCIMTFQSEEFFLRGVRVIAGELTDDDNGNKGDKGGLKEGTLMVRVYKTLAEYIISV